MKKLINGISITKLITGMTMEVLLLMMCIVMLIANAETVEMNNVDDRDVYHKSIHEVDDWICEWIESVGDVRHLINAGVDGCYRGHGVIDGTWFMKEYGCKPTTENIEAICNYEFDLSEYSVVVAGYYDDYAVYKMHIKSNDKAIGKEDDMDIYECIMYYMVVYND